jgi:hypothetical protein
MGRERCGGPAERKALEELDALRRCGSGEECSTTEPRSNELKDLADHILQGDQIAEAASSRSCAVPFYAAPPHGSNGRLKGCWPIRTAH